MDILGVTRSNKYKFEELQKFKQLIGFSKTTAQKITEVAPTYSNTQLNANDEMELVGQLSNLSIGANEIHKHETCPYRTKIYFHCFMSCR